jgi:hypothetical protein
MAKKTCDKNQMRLQLEQWETTAHLEDRARSTHRGNAGELQSQIEQQWRTTQNQGNGVAGPYDGLLPQAIHVHGQLGQHGHVHQRGQQLLQHDALANFQSPQARPALGASAHGSKDFVFPDTNVARLRVRDGLAIHAQHLKLGSDRNTHSVNKRRAQR